MKAPWWLREMTGLWCFACNKRFCLPDSHPKEWVEWLCKPSCDAQLALFGSRFGREKRDLE